MSRSEVGTAAAAAGKLHPAGSVQALTGRHPQWLLRPCDPRPSQCQLRPPLWPFVQKGLAGSAVLHQLPMEEDAQVVQAVECVQVSETVVVVHADLRQSPEKAMNFSLAL